MKHLLIGGFRLDRRAGELSKRGRVVRLQEQAFVILQMLADQPGEVVLRDEIRQRLWPDQSVLDFDHRINVAINKLREAFGDTAKAPRFIETVARRGYRLIAPIEEAEPAEPPTPEPPSAPVPSASSPNGKPRRRTVVVIVLGILLAGSGAALLWIRPWTSGSIPERSLTGNAPEDSVNAAAVSPDGKTLAFSRANRLFLQTLASGSLTPVPLPISDPISSLAWSPDSSRVFFVASPQVSWDGDLYAAALFSANPPVKLRSHAGPAAVSPDGHTIAFLEDQGQALAIMDADGEEAQAVFRARTDLRLAYPVWTSEGIVFGQISQVEEAPGGWITSWDPKSRRSTDVLNFTGRLRGLASLTGRRLAYLMLTNTATELREVSIGPPGTSRLIRANISQAETLSAPLDGRSLLYRKITDLVSIYIGDYAASGISGLRRVSSFEDNGNYVHDWTPDSRAILLESSWGGRFHIFRKTIDNGAVEAFVSGTESGVGPRFSPDARWILFNRYLNSATGDPGSQYQIVKVPAEGGRASIVADEPEPFNFRCAHVVAGGCVVLSGREGSLAFRQLDPERGVGAELLSIRERPTDWDLASDGGSVAMVFLHGDRPRIQVAALGGHAAVRQTEAAGWKRLHTVNWAADGKGWIVCAEGDDPSASALLHVGEGGTTEVLHPFHNIGCPWAVPSRDGRYIAFSQVDRCINVRMISLTGLP